jgi:hypothetical protein
MVKYKTEILWSPIQIGPKFFLAALPIDEFFSHPLEGKKNSVNTTRIFFNANLSNIYTKKTSVYIYRNFSR